MKKPRFLRYYAGPRSVGLFLLHPAADDGDHAPDGEAGGHHPNTDDDEVVVGEGQLTHSGAVNDAVHGVGVHGGVQDVLDGLPGEVPGGGVVGGIQGGVHLKAGELQIAAGAGSV